MGVQIKQLEKTAVLTVEGARIAGKDDQGLKKAFEMLRESSCKHVVVDLSGVEFIDSMGMGAFVSGRMLLRNRCEIHLCCLGEKLETLFTVSKLNKIFAVFASLEEALASPGQSVEDLEETQP